MNFGELLREKRKALGLTTTRCAAEIGITQPAWNQWELGVREPKFEMLQKICALLECTANDLLGMSDGEGRVTVHAGNGAAVAVGSHAKAKATVERSDRDCDKCPYKKKLKALEKMLKK